MQVKGNHQIVAFGDDLMRLYDSDTGETLVTAERNAGVWTVHALVGNVPDKDVPTGEPPRGDAIQAMVDIALEALPGTGYSCSVPYGLADLP